MENDNLLNMKPESKADKFWGMFLPTKNGKLKSTLLINSFSVSLLFIAVYVSAYLLLIDPINSLVSGHISPKTVSFFESIVPALIGSAICCSFDFLCNDKRIVPFAYLWVFLYGFVLFVGIRKGLQSDAVPIFLSLYRMVIVAPLIIGSLFCAFLHILRKRNFWNNND
ncbi:MAG TPA: hypothetical protein DD738_02345 [Ruminiclostridium sp.]|jgi:hypothetical protein|nr:hypothetical protein [Ruminiclostridium sp.]